jgi:hypothetical protein
VTRVVCTLSRPVRRSPCSPRGTSKAARVIMSFIWLTSHLLSQMASDEAIAAADAAKAAANKLYAENKLDDAVQAYTTALQLLPELDGSDEDMVASLVGSKEAGLRAILLTNRAQCLLMQVIHISPHSYARHNFKYLSCLTYAIRARS